MPLHDWTRASPGMFPDFHSSWLTDLKRTLNRGRLPPGYFAMSGQRASLYGPDVLTLTAVPRPAPAPHPAGGNGVAVAEPQTARRLRSHGLPATGRALTVRHAGGKRIVAVIEVVSPANKDRPESVGDFAGKVVGLVRNGIHVVVVDILPHDPAGLHPAIWSGLDTEPESAAPPADRPYTFAGYRADDKPLAYLEYGAVGLPPPPVPLYLDGGVFVNVPLEETYMTNYAELPAELKAELG
jgi:hypothetical protein